MSFTSEVKNELSKISLEKIEAITELSAIIGNNEVLENKIIITTENPSVARHVFNLIKQIYNINSKITVRRGYNYKKNYIYILEINKKLDVIKKDLDLNNLIPSDYIISDDNLLRIYLRGVFLSCGSINDPKKSRYHLEFIISDLNYAEFLNEKLNIFSLNSKIIKREKNYMVYIKEAEKIGDFLRMISAIKALLYYEDIRIYRDHKNMTNRLNNCEQANVDKIIQTATNQLKDIELLEEYGVMELLDDKIKEACLYRKKYKDVSLSDLSEIIAVETGNKITKSGLHHRFAKIKELASKIKNSKKDVN